VPRLDQEGLYKVFRIPLFQPTDQRSVVGEHHGKIGKKMVRNERKKEGKKERKKEKRKKERKEKCIY
jgi:hypothetical protein